ncbi:50S ribosomal protein L11 methyltransferase [Terrimonas sp.]|uniref:50S ribosomal protein L11 methyltransferase n=1 Tax=Terrimonas sp. TaxID=1914338 RepID=UPI000D510AC9|nr:50S ribosomal protein L11 methyltransferase [Terrimonas sp.]PVD50862.1 50S ribosomal protein L11 methyltransferase [Terrimonas sp.]
MINEIFIEIAIAISDAEAGELLLAQLNEEMEIAGAEELPGVLKLYINNEHFNEIELNKIIEYNNLKHSKSIINNKNWNEEWERSYEPVVAGNVGIRADFHARNENIKYDILVTPKMSFGTGHHATTSMMVEAIAEFDLAGKKVIDFGTGTGVLAILAHKMNATEIIAIDHDDWSIENAAENFEKNDCSSIQLRKMDHFPAGFYDMILANINLNVIADNMEEMAKSLDNAGVLLVSGILVHDFDEILNISKKYGLQLKKKSEKNNWLCIAFKKEASELRK